MSVFDSHLADMNEVLLDTFGDEATYTTPNAPPVTLSLIKVSASQYEASAPGQNIIRWVRTSDLPLDAASGDSVVIGAESFDVIDVQTKDGGGSWLTLSKA